MKRLLIALVLTVLTGTCMLVFLGKDSLAESRQTTALANPLEQRAEMIQELRAIRALLKEQNDLLREQLQLLRKLATEQSGPTPR